MTSSSWQRVLPIAVLSLVSACGGSEQGPLERKDTGVPLTTTVAGSSMTDLWAVAPIEGKLGLAYSKDGSRWQAVTPEELNQNVPVGRSAPWLLASGGSGRVWITGLGSDEKPALLQMGANGAVEDFSAELPAMTYEVGSLHVTDGAVLIGVNSRDTADKFEGKVLRRTHGAFEEVPGFPASQSLKVLGVRNADDFYVWSQPPGASFTKPQLLHFRNGTAQALNWPDDTAPDQVEISDTGEVWIFRRGLSGGTVLHGDGDTFALWAKQPWPEQEGYQGEYFFTFAAAVDRGGTLSFFSRGQDLGIYQHLPDREGKVGEGVLLARGIDQEDVPNSLVRLGDGTLILPSGSGKAWFVYVSPPGPRE